MTRIITTAFSDHPASVGESYAEHARFAISMGGLLLLAGTAALIHGLFPFLCTRTASHIIGRLGADMAPRGPVSK